MNSGTLLALAALVATSSACYQIIEGQPADSTLNRASPDAAVADDARAHDVVTPPDRPAVVAPDVSSTPSTALLQPGASCDRFRRLSFPQCAPGSHCQSAVDLSWSRCIIDGSELGECRSLDARCDADLACLGPADEENCVRLGPQICDPSRARPCYVGLDCATTYAGYLCLPPGRFRGRCRPGATPCDPGLHCAASSGLSTCELYIPLGGECHRPPNRTLCEPGLRCEILSGDVGRCAH